VVRLRHLYNPHLYEEESSSGDGGRLFRPLDDARLVLNYLDGIAIGVQQGLYIENLARDHLSTIVRTHVTEVFEKKRVDLAPADYVRLVDMDHKWQRSQPYYKAETGLLTVASRPITVTVIACVILVAFFVFGFLNRGYLVDDPSGTPTPSLTAKPAG
jgi:hypothetical protein